MMQPTEDMNALGIEEIDAAAHPGSSTKNPGKVIHQIR